MLFINGGNKLIYLPGSCQCFPGYGSASCMVDMTKGPEVVVLGLELCDVSTGDACTCASVAGDGFVQNATCNVKMYEVRWRKPNQSGVTKYRLYEL